MSTSALRFTLFQARRPDDPMRTQEIECFARVLSLPNERLRPFDLLRERFDKAAIEAADVFLFGGSGDYSVVGEADWLDHALDVARIVHDTGKPTFASCWGFQAMARAMGGSVINDVERAEVGTHSLFLTDAGRVDPVFSPLGGSFKAQMGHEDHVVELPPGTTLLASTELNPCQAYRFDDAPVYCTQFHPELAAGDLEARFAIYPRYLDSIPGMSRERFEETLEETPESSALLARFIDVMTDAG